MACLAWVCVGFCLGLVVQANAENFYRFPLRQEVVFGSPATNSHFESLGSGQTVFNTVGNTQTFGYEQVKYRLGYHSPNYYVGFDLATENLVGSTNTFNILFDTPTVQVIKFRPEGWITTLYAGGGEGLVGRFADGAVMRVGIYLEMANGRWAMQINGSNVFSHELVAAGTDLDSVRFHLGPRFVNSTPPSDTVTVGINNVFVSPTAVPEPSGGVLAAGSFALLLVLNLRRSRKALAHTSQ